MVSVSCIKGCIKGGLEWMQTDGDDPTEWDP